MRSGSAVAVWGLGHIGLVTAGGLLSRGRKVIGIDSNPEIVARLKIDGAPTDSPVALAEIIGESVANRDLVLPANPSDALYDACADVICVDAPTGNAGNQDLASVFEVVDSINSLRGNRKNHIIVLRTTVLPGTTERLALTVDADIVVHPSFVRDCDFEQDWLGRIVVGVSDSRQLEAFADAFCLSERDIIGIDRASAELVKYLDNAFHALKITFANESGRLAHSLGLSPQLVMGILADDKRLNASSAYLRPGEAFGGRCLPKDLKALVHFVTEVGTDLPLIAAIRKSNSLHGDFWSSACRKTLSMLSS